MVIVLGISSDPLNQSLFGALLTSDITCLVVTVRHSHFSPEIDVAVTTLMLVCPLQVVRGELLHI